MKKVFKQLKLTDEQLNKNKVVFFKTNEKYNIITDELAEFLGDNIFTAPASTQVDLHNCFEGGLLDHIIRVTTYAHKLNKILPESMQQEDESITKVCFLSQIGKTMIFFPQENQWHKDNLGKYYDFKNDIVAMRVGERSAYLATNYGVKLKDYEYQAIVAHDADDTDTMYKWYSDTLTNILKSAIKFSVIEEKEKWKKIQ